MIRTALGGGRVEVPWLPVMPAQKSGFAFIVFMVCVEKLHETLEGGKVHCVRFSTTKLSIPFS